MTEKECYAVLEISKNADLETVKKAYRRLAFAFHPDLNPSLPGAARRFQLINEAYVTLVHIHAEKKSAQGRRSTAQNTSAEESPEATDRAKRDAEKAYAKAQKTQSDVNQTEQDESSNAQRASTASANNPDGSENADQGQSGGDGGKERVINDILSDPFAKRVFEDIYKRIQDVAHEKIIRPAAEVVMPAKDRKKGNSGTSVLGKIRNWALRQIDDEQILRLPGGQILPGARIRMQIQHGLKAEIKTIEVTLPLDFAPGKTMRLKGMGKQVGSLAGDLYVRIDPL